MCARAARAHSPRSLGIVEQHADRARELAGPVGRDEPTRASVASISSRTAGRSDAITGTPAAIDSRIFSGAQPCTTLREQSRSGASESERVLAPARQLLLGQREVPVHAVGDAELLGELAVRLGAARVDRRADDELEPVDVEAAARARAAPCRRPATAAARRSTGGSARARRVARRGAGRMSAPLGITCRRASRRRDPQRRRDVRRA